MTKEFLQKIVLKKKVKPPLHLYLTLILNYETNLKPFYGTNIDDGNQNAVKSIIVVSFVFLLQNHNNFIKMEHMRDFTSSLRETLGN